MATTCPVAFIPHDPEYCPRCSCDQAEGHTDHHHCPDCDVWWKLGSEKATA